MTSIPTAPAGPVPAGGADPFTVAAGNDDRADAGNGSSRGHVRRRPTSDIAVPHVVGHHIDLALRMLEDIGLRARVLTTEVHDKTDRHVVATMPAAGALAATDLVVEVVVGIAPLVGDYVGLDVDDAHRLAERDGHLVEVLVDDTDRDPRPETGTGAPLAGPARATVVGQEPDPGERGRVVILRAGTSTTPPTRGRRAPVQREP